MNRKNTLMQKMDKNKGFTLAELLIVVAIIAVLVAISIPIFSSQLEKAREATDLANVRAAYAEVMAAAITDEEAEPITVSLVQKQDDFQTAGEINIGGITKANKTQWVGIPHAGGSAKVSYDSSIGVIINWNGGAVISSIGTTKGNWQTTGNSYYTATNGKSISTYNSARADGLYELESGKTYTISCTYSAKGNTEQNQYGLTSGSIILFGSDKTKLLDAGGTNLNNTQSTSLINSVGNKECGTYQYTKNTDGTYTFTATFTAPETDDGKCYLGMNFWGHNLNNNTTAELSNFLDVDQVQSQIQNSFTVEEVSSN